MVKGTIGNPYLSGNLGLRLVARSYQLHCFLLKFSGKRFLLLGHGLDPFFVRSTLSIFLGQDHLKDERAELVRLRNDNDALRAQLTKLQKLDEQ